MTTFVIVHGGWGGGWEWLDVARLLSSRRHEAFTPTLTGLGERHHLGHEVDLGIHIQDVIGVLEYNDLRDVVLCGHSYSGMVVTGAADRAPDRVAQVIYADAFIPEDGQAIIDLMPEEFSEYVKASADERGHGAFEMPDEFLPPEGSLPADKREWYVSRIHPHSVATFTQPLQLSGAIDRIPRAFIRCTADGTDPQDPIERMAERAKAGGWPYREIATPHDLQLFDPEGTAELLEELAGITARA